MAIFRKVHVTFWKDSFIESLTPEQKYFYLYLLTNDRTKQCGIYEITLKQICYDTGYNIDTVQKLLEFFFLKKKVMYSEKTQEMAIKNWGKYNDSSSPKVKACITKELSSVKDTVCIQYVYSMDTHTQEEQEQEEEREQEREYTHQLKNSNLFRQPKIPTEEEVHQAFCSAGGTKEMATVFFEKNNSVGWFLKGSPITNFKNLLPSFISNWQKNESNRKQGANARSNDAAESFFKRAKGRHEAAISGQANTGS